ncbi:M3 family metallopeptidase [Pseudovibrio exalbescens]|uniref:M3 family metallopeptidase n=1 Tax=Pseudovibrio exalbescens TaxID=197461 RepID=UPI002366D360|nr:M3 family metallopeptidase [Pseudovibrio exalbescens]MDD7908432.1 M3 family metallopeptidase [Pseudovibrio exalbescens]
MSEGSSILLAEWDTPFGLPPFSKFNSDDFSKAFDEALQKAEEDVAAIAANIDAPSFENTILALETAGRELTQVASVFFNLSGSHTNPTLQATERDVAPKLAAHSSKILLNADIFARIKSLSDNIGSMGLDAEQKRVVERYMVSFTRAGAGLDEASKKRMAEITQRLATLGTQFAQNVLADEADYKLVLKTEADIEGLPQFLIDAAKEAATERGDEGAYVITLSRSSIEPFLQFSKRRDLRETAFKAWASRGEKPGDTSNLEIIKETVALRQERAKLLGFDSFAAFKLDDTMAKTPAAVTDLLENIWKPARARALEEAADLQEMAQSQGDNLEIAPWDWRYYSEKVRQKKHELDEEEIKPYFQLDKMIEAAFYTANRLFGISFKEISDVDRYHPDIRVYEVLNADGSHRGIFIGDYFARTSKRSGAWMSAFRKQHRTNGDVAPIIVNVMNFSKAPEGAQTLLTFDDARTLFHEFGHALHGLLSDVTYPVISGTSVSRDFVELPSQLYEHWLSEPEVLERFAVHYKTGEPIPQALLDKLLAAANFNQGFATVEYLATAMVDMAIHSEAKDDLDPQTFEKEVLERIDMPSQIIMRHRTPHLAHAFAGDGYSAGYYSYIWSEVMDADAFEAFKEAGDPFHPETAQRLLTAIYSAGGKQSPEQAYLDFRGKMPSIEPLLKGRGLAETEVPA